MLAAVTRLPGRLPSESHGCVTTQRDIEKWRPAGLLSKAVSPGRGQASSTQARRAVLAPPDPCPPCGAGLWAGWRGSPLTLGGDRGDRGQHHRHVWAPCRDHICHFLGSWHPPLMKRECHRVWAREGPSVGRGRRQPCHRRGQAAALPKALASPSCTRLPGPPPGPGPLTRTTRGHTPPAPAGGSGTGVSHEETNQ